VEGINEMIGEGLCAWLSRRGSRLTGSNYLLNTVGAGSCLLNCSSIEENQNISSSLID
jgi:hypothetical protein